MKPWAWDVFTRRPAPAPGMLAELSRLRAALPGYDVTITSHASQYRYQAIQRHNSPGPSHAPWCVISTDAADLWHELAPRTRPRANTGTRAARAP